MQTMSLRLFKKLAEVEDDVVEGKDKIFILEEVEIHKDAGSPSEIVDTSWKEFGVMALPVGISQNGNLLFELQGTLEALHAFDKGAYDGGLLEAGLIPPLPELEEKEKIELEHKYVLIKETYNRCDLEKAEVVGYYDEYPGVPQKEFVRGCLCCYITHRVGEIINAKG